MDGLAQRWGGTQGQSGPLCLVFPPPALLALALQKVAAERAEAIVVRPCALLADTVAALRRLPVTHGVRLTAPHHVLMQRSRAVPAAVRVGGRTS